NTLGGRFKGTADAVYQYLDVVQAHSADMVAVFAADHIYRMDVRQMTDFHAANAADVTVAAVGVPVERARGFGVLKTAADGRVLGTLSALAAAQQDAMGSRPRFNLWNARWPIRGEYEGETLGQPPVKEEPQAELTAPAPWRAGRRDRHTDERVPTS